MKHQEAIAESNISQTHDEDTKQLTPNPLLVTGGSVNPGKQGVTGLTFKTQGGAEIKISLNKTLLHALCRLLIESTMKADWDLGLVVVSAAAGLWCRKTRRRFTESGCRLHVQFLSSETLALT